MSMTGMMKTFTKDDIQSKREVKEKKHIDSYNPATSSRELNPYWKGGGSGIPQTPEDYRKSRQFLKPSNDDDYYSSTKKQNKQETQRYDLNVEKSYNWRKHSKEKKECVQEETARCSGEVSSINIDKIKSEGSSNQSKDQDSLYLSDEKMNKLGAKIVKAEILGDMKLVEKLKAKLEAAREYRKNNPNAGKIDDDNRVLLMSTSTSGNSRPLVNNLGDPHSKGGKRKAETHDSSGRLKYFGNDDKYDLARMVSICKKNILFINIYILLINILPIIVLIIILIILVSRREIWLKL